jgi:polysaccharide export outer membrane protein
VVANSVILGGEVLKPGRLVLPTNRETLSDVIALAGGYRGDAKDLTVKVQRQGERVDLRLSDLLTTPVQDLRVYPGDRISVTRQPWTFAVMGAPGRTEHVTFTAPHISLAEALATAGGSNANSGDPKAVFVFRFERDADGKEVPLVYHINMMKAQSYFVSQKFAMHDKDILYIGNARANQPAKFIQILSQLFTPVILARQLTE